MIVLEPKIYSFEQLMELDPWIGHMFFTSTKKELEIALKELEIALKKHNRTIFLNDVSEEKLPNEEIKVMCFDLKFDVRSSINFLNEIEIKGIDEYNIFSNNPNTQNLIPHSYQTK